ncbi:MAG: hypothetical protein JWR89_2111 [Tardiphaga sp.]|nr:hypothetical protein [Tardiphaga sp.]
MSLADTATHVKSRFALQVTCFASITAKTIGNFMSQSISYQPARDPLPDHEQKQAALSYLNEAWAEARHDGVDGDCLAQASLFAAFAELVGTYGEDAVAKFVEGLPGRVRNGEFSLVLARQ